MKTRNKFLSYLVTTISFALIPITLIAGESSLKNNNSSSLEDLWDIPQLYSDSDSSLINDLKLVGRYQWQYGDVNFDEGDYSDSEVRRFRLGTEAKILGGDWKVKGEINVNDDFSPFYKSLEEAFENDEFFLKTDGSKRASFKRRWDKSFWLPSLITSEKNYRFQSIYM